MTETKTTEEELTLAKASVLIAKFDRELALAQGSLASLRGSNEASARMYGSELCAGDMLLREDDLLQAIRTLEQKKRLIERVRSRQLPLDPAAFDGDIAGVDAKIAVLAKEREQYECFRTQIIEAVAMLEE